MTKKLKTSPIWEVRQTECPHCSEILDIDSSDIERPTQCKVCKNEFIHIKVVLNCPIGQII